MSSFPRHSSNLDTGNFANLNLLKVEENCMTPKYVQIVEILMSDIENGIFKTGQQVPSINETCAEFYIAKETAQKAYNILKLKGILKSVKGKGYFVSKPEVTNQSRSCLLLFPDYDEDKRTIFKAYSRSIDSLDQTQVYLFHDDLDQLEKCLYKNKDNFDYFIIYLDCTQPATITKLLSGIAKEKVCLIGNSHNCIDNYFSIIADDADKMFECLSEVKSEIRRYKRMKLVFPDSKKYANIIKGLTKAGKYCGIPVTLFSTYEQMEIEKNDLVVVAEESDMVNIANQIEVGKITLGKDAGLLGYTDSVVRQILCGGISVIGPDYNSLGTFAANHFRNCLSETHINSFVITFRNSF